MLRVFDLNKACCIAKSTPNRSNGVKIMKNPRESKAVSLALTVSLGLLACHDRRVPRPQQQEAVRLVIDRMDLGDATGTSSRIDAGVAGTEQAENARYGCLALLRPRPVLTRPVIEGRVLRIRVKEPGDRARDDRTT